MGAPVWLIVGGWEQRGKEGSVQARETATQLLIAVTTLSVASPNPAVNSRPDTPPTWQLCTEGNALPALASIARVQQDGGLTHNPALITAEADRLEPAASSNNGPEKQQREGAMVVSAQAEESLLAAACAAAKIHV